MPPRNATQDPPAEGTETPAEGTAPEGAPAEPEAATAAPRQLTNPSEVEGVATDDMIGQACVNAYNLIVAKRKIQADIQSARDFLNQAVTLGVVSEVQAAWINETLPKRKRGPRNGSAADSDSE